MAEVKLNILYITQRRSLSTSQLENQSREKHGNSFKCIIYIQELRFWHYAVLAFLIAKCLERGIFVSAT